MKSNLTLFISYRRADSSGWAGRLQADLRSRLGTDAQVFMDVDAIPAGEDFVRAVEDAVSRSHALVALIGPDWVTAQDAQGRRRLDDPNDLVRIEIVAALQRGIRVIPTLVGGASLPSPEVLPEMLRALTRRQALRLDNETWNLGLSRLVRAIEHPRRAPLIWFTRLRLEPARRIVIVGLLLAMLAMSAIYWLIRPQGFERCDGEWRNSVCLFTDFNGRGGFTPRPPDGPGDSNFHDNPCSGCRNGTWGDEASSLWNRTGDRYCFYTDIDFTGRRMVLQDGEQVGRLSGDFNDAISSGRPDGWMPGRPC